MSFQVYIANIGDGHFQSIGLPVDFIPYEIIFNNELNSFQIIGLAKDVQQLVPYRIHMFRSNQEYQNHDYYNFVRDYFNKLPMCKKEIYDRNRYIKTEYYLPFICSTIDLQNVTQPDFFG